MKFKKLFAIILTGERDKAFSPEVKGLKTMGRSEQIIETPYVCLGKRVTQH